MSKNELVVAAATKNNNDGENDNPGAVIVENTAEAIAIHICLTFQREVFYVRAAVLLPHTLTFYEGIHFLLLKKPPAGDFHSARGGFSFLVRFEP